MSANGQTEINETEDVKSQYLGLSEKTRQILERGNNQIYYAV